MTLKEFIENAGKYLGEMIGKRFTGKVTFTVNFREGGIANANVNIEHSLQRYASEEPHD